MLQGNVISLQAGDYRHREPCYNCVFPHNTLKNLMQNYKKSNENAKKY